MESWERSLRARNLAPKTVTVYGESARQFTAYLAGKDVADPNNVTKAHAEDFITRLLERRSAAHSLIRASTEPGAVHRAAPALDRRWSSQ